MKNLLSLMFLVCVFSSLGSAQTGIYQHGSVVRMHMGDCMLAHHGFVTAFGGPATAAPQEYCPEYTLLSQNVVYVIVGRSSEQLIPLALTIDFRLHKNELAVRVDDAKRESKFAIKEMMVRSDWERIQKHMEDQMTAAENETASRNRN